MILSIQLYDNENTPIQRIHLGIGPAYRQQFTGSLRSDQKVGTIQFGACLQCYRGRLIENKTPDATATNGD